MIHLKNIVLIFLSYLYFLVRGKATKIPQSFRRILVVHNSKMGDMVCITPIFRAIKKKYPSSRVIVMGLPINRQVLAGNLDVDEYVDYKRDASYLRHTFSELKINAALLFAPDDVALASLYLANVPLIVAPTITGTKAETATITYRLLTKLVTTVTYIMVTNYTPAEYLKILEPLGIKTNDTKKHLAFSAQANNTVKSFLIKHNVIPGEDFIIGIAPSAGNKVKNWLPDRYASIIIYLRETYHAKILIIGGPPDKGINEEVFKNLAASPDVIDTTSLFSIEELKALIAHMNLFISGDTGPIHIADAFDVPSVNILGPVGEIEMPPRGPYHRNVIPPRQKPVLFVMTVRSFDPIEAQKQIDDTTVPMVRKVIDALISDIRNSRSSGV